MVSYDYDQDYMSEMEWLDIFADNLRDILAEYGMTQRELAEAAGLSEVTISRYMHKKTIPSIPAAINISYALSMTLEELLNFGSMVR